MVAPFYKGSENFCPDRVMLPGIKSVLLMNRFRELAFIEYKGRITVHRSLLNVGLHD
jgi:hypothetical protein